MRNLNIPPIRSLAEVEKSFDKENQRVYLLRLIDIASIGKSLLFGVNSVSLLYRNLSKSPTVFTLFIEEVRVFVSNSSTYLLYHIKVLSLIGDFALLIRARNFNL